MPIHIVGKHFIETDMSADHCKKKLVGIAWNHWLITDSVVVEITRNITELLSLLPCSADCQK